MSAPPQIPGSVPARPLLVAATGESLARARAAGAPTLRCSMDLQRSECEVGIAPTHWQWNGVDYPYPARLRDRTVYCWSGDAFEPVARFDGGLIKLVPTDWGPPTFEIDGIKMLPTAKISPLQDARTKVSWVEPRGKAVLDCCGGLGYFAVACLEQGAARIHSFEKSDAVRWLRSVNPWSQADDARLALQAGAVEEALPGMAPASVDAVLHDPPRFGIAGELYSLAFYEQLARVLRRGGLLFHYTGTPNRLTSGRDVPAEVKRRLEQAGFTAQRRGDGLLARRR
ncbi:MAG: MnmC family methyltransferase [Steroidobacteraceae bacterium]